MIKYFYYTFVLMPDMTSQTDKKDYTQIVIKPKKKTGPKTDVKPKTQITEKEPKARIKEQKTRERAIFILEFDDN